MADSGVVRWHDRMSERPWNGKRVWLNRLIQCTRVGGGLHEVCRLTRDRARAVIGIEGEPK